MPTSTASALRPPSDLNPRTDPPLDFPDRAVGELSADDYRVLGFLGGLEVHQQLRTRSKLFCRCPAGRYVDHHEGEVLRHMRPTLSELGEYDGTALMEFKTRKEIVYLLERGSVCTYEMDDTPPFPIDGEAVEIAIAAAQLLNLNLVAELHVMRKQYLDGSIPTGFQRTAMVGLSGHVPFRVPELGVDRALTIRQLSLEEDSCREVSDVGHRITFRTDRLGMPLTEAVTEPELVTPLEMQAAGRLLADVARATRRIRRGPGAARQDVNVSVAGGRRVEIKGVDNHRHLPRLVHIEAFRQLNLLRVRAELSRRGVTADTLTLEAAGLPWEVSPLVVEVRGSTGGVSGAVGDALERGMTMCAVRLPGFGGLLAHRTQPGRTFAHELSERVRVIACPEHARFLAHSDDPDCGIPRAGWRDLGERLGVESGDAIVVLWAPRDEAATAAREVLLRAVDAVAGVPAETRQAHRDGTTGFERILPGPDRMYPDTDTPPLPIADAVVERIRAAIPERPWDRMARYHSLGLTGHDARRLAVAAWADAFDAAAPTAPATARRLAASLAKRIPYHLRRGRDIPDTLGATLAAALRAIDAGQIRPEVLDRIVDAAVARPDAGAGDVIGRFRRDGDAAVALHRVVEDVTARARAMRGRRPDTLIRWAMGQAMRTLLGRADPAAVRRRLADGIAVPAPEAVR